MASLMEVACGTHVVWLYSEELLLVRGKLNLRKSVSSFLVAKCILWGGEEDSVCVCVCVGLSLCFFFKKFQSIAGF